MEQITVTKKSLNKTNDVNDLFFNFAEGFPSFSPKQDGSNISPHSSDNQTTSKPSIDLPKPKKFFKSRNIAPDFNSQQFAFSEYQQQKSPIIPATPKLSLKIKLKNDDTKKSKSEKIKKEKSKDKTKEKEKSKEKVKEKLKEKVKEKVKKKPKLKEEKKLKNEEAPTRVLSRARKSVNYYEDNSRSQTPVRYDTPSQQGDEENEKEPIDTVEQMETVEAIETVEPIKAAEPVEIAEPIPVIKIPLTPASKKLTPPQSIPEPTAAAVVNIENVPENLSIGGSSNKAHDHPPIVLRISKVCTIYGFFFNN